MALERGTGTGLRGTEIPLPLTALHVNTEVGLSAEAMHSAYAFYARRHLSSREHVATLRSRSDQYSPIRQCLDLITALYIRM